MWNVNVNVNGIAYPPPFEDVAKPPSALPRTLPVIVANREDYVIRKHKDVPWQMETVGDGTDPDTASN